MIQQTAPAISAGDTAWVLVSSALVLLMVPGLALFYGGLVRSRAILNTFMMSFAALAVVGVQWVLFGYALAFEPGVFANKLSWFGLNGVGAEAGPYSATIPHVAFSVFQVMFAGITVALISGAMVERIRFRVYLAFAVLWTTLVYDPIAHFVWGADGWLHTLGALDFAGGTVVHITAGTAALVAAIILGRRRDLGRTPLVPHNVPFVLAGAGLLWVGWLGFNGGSALAADGIASNAVMTTNAAASAALVTWLLLDTWKTGQATAVGGATGAVVGLVAITPAAGFVTPLAALAIGALGACASFAAIHLRNKTRIDDALDVFACHGVAGMAGALLTGVFATKSVNPLGNDGLLYGNPKLLGIQAIAVVFTVLFTAPVTFVVLTRLTFGKLRVPVPDELTGIDITEHGEHAYHEGGGADLTGAGVRLGEAVVFATPRRELAESEAA
jgi:Amt family ammonium transporter